MSAATALGTVSTIRPLRAWEFALAGDLDQAAAERLYQVPPLMTPEPRRIIMSLVCAECNQWRSVDDENGEPGMCQSCFERESAKRLKGLQDELRDVVEAFIDRGTADDIDRVLKAVRGDQSAT